MPGPAGDDAPTPLERGYAWAYSLAAQAGYDVAGHPHWAVFCPSCETRVLHSTDAHTRLHEHLDKPVTVDRIPWWTPRP